MKKVISILFILSTLSFFALTGLLVSNQLSPIYFGPFILLSGTISFVLLSTLMCYSNKNWESKLSHILGVSSIVFVVLILTNIVPILETWNIGFSLVISQLIVSLYASISSRINAFQKILFGSTFLIPLGIALRLTNDIFYVLCAITLIISSSMLFLKRSSN